MPGGRKTHAYPYGTPVGLVLVDAGMGFGLLLWIIFASGNWTRVAGILALFAAYALIHSKLHQAYERTGLAVPIASELQVVRFREGVPAPLRALRAAFFWAPSLWSSSGWLL